MRFSDLREIWWTCIIDDLWDQNFREYLKYYTVFYKEKNEYRLDLNDASWTLNAQLSVKLVFCKIGLLCKKEKLNNYLQEENMSLWKN